MESFLNLTRKTVEDLSPGELVLITPGDQPALSLFLGRMGGIGEAFGILQGQDFEETMITYVGDIYDRCLSYGIGWFLEERPGPETGVSSPAVMNEGIRLYVDKGKLLMRFSAARGIMESPASFDLLEGTLSSHPSRSAAPITKWAIWASREAFNNPRCKPIFEYMPSE